MIEHRLIERMVAQVTKESKRIEQGGSPSLDLLEAAVDFFRTYADRCHHGKEEDILFVKLGTKSMSPPMRQAMERLKEEHTIARGLVGQLVNLAEKQRGGDGTAAADISRAFAEMGRLYPEHIRKEDKEFFPTAMTYLDDNEREEMLNAFGEFDRKLVHERYKAVVEEVERR